MEKLRFYKENTGEWYIDLPDWTGEKAELEMVQGADLLLDYLAGKKNDVVLNISNEKFDEADSLDLIRESLVDGAYYILENYKNINICLPIWLCNVTKFVLGGFPDKIYFKI